jgi:hypothetical protein
MHLRMERNKIQGLNVGTAYEDQLQHSWQAGDNVADFCNQIAVIMMTCPPSLLRASHFACT